MTAPGEKADLLGSLGLLPAIAIIGLKARQAGMSQMARKRNGCFRPFDSQKQTIVLALLIGGAFIAERLHKQRESRRLLAAARVVEMVPGEAWAPLLKHAHQAS